MQLTINLNQTIDSAVIYVLDKLPNDIREKLINFLTKHKLYVVNEIKIRVSSFISFFIKTTEIKTDVFIFVLVRELERESVA